MNIRGERILIFGDSLSHHGADSDPEIWDVDAGSTRSSSQPGDLLASLLREQGAAAVRVNARVGRSAPGFFSQEAASSLLASDARFRPTRVIVMLGTNDLGLDPTVDAQALRQIRSAYQQMGAREVIAIGPPIFADSTLNAQSAQVYQTLRQVFGRVVDARPLSSVFGRAGVHFQPAAARLFANQLLGAIRPTALTVTTSGLSQGAKVVLGTTAIAGLAGLGWLSWRLARSASAASLSRRRSRRYAKRQDQ